MKFYFQSKYITNRSPYSTNVLEGGALNANYTDVETVVMISNQLGQAGYEYKKDFYFINCGGGVVVLEFFNQECASTAALIFGDAVTASLEYLEKIL